MLDIAGMFSRIGDYFKTLIVTYVSVECLQAPNVPLKSIRHADTVHGTQIVHVIPLDNAEIQGTAPVTSKKTCLYLQGGGIFSRLVKIKGYIYKMGCIYKELQ